jgi:Fic family protein
MIVSYDTIMSMKNKSPPFKITEKIFNLSLDISRVLGSLSVSTQARPPVHLRKTNQIKTIQGSLAIEGNTLSLEQVTDLLDDVPVIGPPKDILEVKNAIEIYQNLQSFRFEILSSFKKAHHMLMQGLVPDAGLFREGNVGIFAGEKVSHVAPPAKQVLRLMDTLFDYLKQKDDTSLLIKACVFHYELEFIHPFMDGNGRMGRLWQHCILMAYHPVFEYLPIESLIKEHQSAYYRVLGVCDEAGESTAFIEFMLALIQESLSVFYENIAFVPSTSEERLLFAQKNLKTQFFSRREYIQLLKTTSTATASRDLLLGVTEGLLLKTGDKRTAKYQFI